MSIQMYYYTSVSDRQIAEAMVDDEEFALNLMIAIAERFSPENLVEHMTREHAVRLKAFAVELELATEEVQ